MIITESSVREALKRFFHIAKLPPMQNQRLENEFIRQNIVPAFIEALKEIEEVRLCYKFDPNLVWRPEDRHAELKENKE